MTSVFDFDTLPVTLAESARFVYENGHRPALVGGGQAMVDDQPAMVGDGEAMILDQ